MKSILILFMGVKVKTADDLIDWAVNEMTIVNNPIELMIRNTKGFERNIRKNERQKIADQIRSMKIEDITDAGSIADAILDS